jgi:hypothetical protein
MLEQNTNSNETETNKNLKKKFKFTIIFFFLVENLKALIQNFPFILELKYSLKHGKQNTKKNF